MADRKKLVTVKHDGSVSGSVWHVHEGCPAQAKATSELMEVSDREIKLLGLGQCRACMRYEILTSEDIIVHLDDILRTTGLEHFMKYERANAAHNLHEAIKAHGLQIIVAPEEKKD